jgi:flagellar basal-body rod modification protein FlgD
MDASGMQSEFLQLLTVQLKNQDPLNPVDQTQMLSQLAQFSSLEQMQSLNTTMSNSATFGSLTQSASLIGKYVTTFNTDGSAGPSGQVSSVTMTNGTPYLQIGNDSIPASQVLTVSNSAPTSGSSS